MTQKYKKVTVQCVLLCVFFVKIFDTCHYFFLSYKT